MIFLQAYPVNSWLERPSDTPLRTIKTVIHNLCKIYGNSILTYLNKIENVQGSELQKYLTKQLKVSSFKHPLKNKMIINNK